LGREDCGEFAAGGVFAGKGRGDYGVKTFVFSEAKGAPVGLIKTKGIGIPVIAGRKERHRVVVGAALDAPALSYGEQPAALAFDPAVQLQFDKHGCHIGCRCAQIADQLILGQRRGAEAA